MSKIEFRRYPVINYWVIDIKINSQLFITGYTSRTTPYQYLNEKVFLVQSRAIPSTYFYFELSCCCRIQNSHMDIEGKNLSNVLTLTEFK